MREYRALSIHRQRHRTRDRTAPGRSTSTESSCDRPPPPIDRRQSIHRHSYIVSPRQPDFRCVCAIAGPWVGDQAEPVRPGPRIGIFGAQPPLSRRLRGDVSSNDVTGTRDGDGWPGSETPHDSPWGGPRHYWENAVRCSEAGSTDWRLHSVGDIDIVWRSR
jgi:hypothetical protein